MPVARTQSPIWPAHTNRTAETASSAADITPAEGLKLITSTLIINLDHIAGAANGVGQNGEKLR